jgi:hypothetical protein
MPGQGWKQLVRETEHFRHEGRYPIVAYSEFIPPPRVGLKPYGCINDGVFHDDDLWGWHITEYEQAWELRPGLEHLSKIIVRSMVDLGNGHSAHGISRHKLTDNPYWPAELARKAGQLPHERYVVLLPLALSRTQDDKGRVRWTLFGGSEQGPSRAFWKSFFTSPKDELPEEQALGFFRNMLISAYGEKAAKLADLHQAGFRILPNDVAEEGEPWGEDPLPSWTSRYLLKKGEPLRTVKYLLTFRPFGQLPPGVRKAYLAGELNLLPFPGSLVFWGVPTYRRMRQELPLAMQLPLLHLVPRHENPYGIRVPQSGWMHEPRADGTTHIDDTRGPIRNTYKRTHRWEKVHREDDALASLEHEDKLAHVLFSTQPDDLGLYGKPMARNVQLWTHDFHLLLDGPHAKAKDIRQAFNTISAGGMYGYRFQFPAMRVGLHQVFWQRPLAAYWSPKSKEAELLSDPPLGYLTAYRTKPIRTVERDMAQPIELWPRLLAREEHRAAIELFQTPHDHRPHTTSRNVRQILQTRQLFDGQPLRRSFARQLLTVAKEETLDHWLAAIPSRCVDPNRAATVTNELQRAIEPEPTPLPQRRGAKTPDSLTFQHTGKRSFEVEYWKTIASLAEGEYVNKDNADCAQDQITRSILRHGHRDLDALGDYLLAYYRRVVEEAGMQDQALVGDFPFRWETDFDFPWWGGWLANQQGKAEERDIVVVIPGRDRSRAVIMGDHYDTAYMENVYEKARGGLGARVAAAGADDNHSATTALMLGAPIFLELSKAGKLDCDIWLIHLTGEEFPSDCMGARHLCQALVEGWFKIRLANGKWKDLSRTQIQGVYVLDMIAHNNDHDRDIFQIAPGTTQQSMWLTYQAHLATETWNASAPVWNQRPERRGRARAERSPEGAIVPQVAPHLHVHGEVRTPYNPRSTLYNTDGQIFSDAGIPVVLFMENYDINREGYHDTHDTMANIDLDYGAAVAAITIESVARAATEKTNGK